MSTIKVKIPVLNIYMFSLVNLYCSHTGLKGQIKFFGGSDNILNEDYEDVLGYTTKGRKQVLFEI